jgi:hypothetical protein
MALCPSWLWVTQNCNISMPFFTTELKNIEENGVTMFFAGYCLAARAEVAINRHAR